MTLTIFLYYRQNRQIVYDGFELALVLAEKETRLKPKDLPKECPYSVEQIFDENFPIGI
jgi:hypothetical protein